MEFGERKRRRKSQSFKLVTDEEDCDPSNVTKASCANGETNDAAVPDVWLQGDESMEIKRQITGMMRLLSDRSGRVYQRVGSEQNSSTKEPKDNLNCTQTLVSSPVSEDPQCNNWSSAGDPEPSSSSTSIPNDPACGQHSTRSRALRILNSTKEPNDALPPAVQEIPCCMCNCKGTLQAILQELRAMRRLMQTQKASFDRQEQAGSTCHPHLGPASTPRRMPPKRRPVYKVAPLSVSNTRRVTSLLGASAPKAGPTESGRREDSEKLDSSTLSMHSVSCDVSVLPHQVGNTPSPPLNQPREHQELESEVRLAEDYDVFISKAQLDSILVNYTRSGSLLFRKLVCAFFDDATLANSLPNGKRKRGLNDNRKGLDQNIVGAIKVFTEKYCTEHRIEKLPGPRDWVQILQDQIKLARRRLKRDAADAEENSNGPSTSMNVT
ncbi:BEN domain-containing protein 7 [Kryptolebias marmoratus]|uniref:BEN domain-containing protein 7 n=1 Tax=Kryptolebias marmoratus TaxID=37003 RepID=UPI0007F8ED06|nr:BEN domain-containing protein 7 [Kryptolebias marmoratus]XP_037833999.1 BEN domain-containing protein 7 [Kryptolebias marmoratus]